ncbi:MAG: diacylglycerol kinase [Armatimonadota bacterium]|nr:diacylglycerol kinase [Armatimonadota bacterium]
MRLRNPLNGFKYAAEGVVHVFRTQRHMKFHFLIMALVLLLSLVWNLHRWEMLVLLFSISMVLVAEMFNTAVEALVDLVTQSYHPLAKFAKDIAAGAVLIAAINALAVGFLLFFGDNRWEDVPELVGVHKPTMPTIFVVAAILTMVYLIIWKVAGGKGRLLKGGVVSGHTALGFFLAATIIFLRPGIPVAAMAVAMALLIAQSRVEGKIHTIKEVVLGALLAVAVSAGIYWLLSGSR